MSFKKRPALETPSLLGASELREVGHDVFGKFSAAVQEMAASLDQDQPDAGGKVFFGDSRCLERALPERCYTRVVTSPPYPNRMSYIRELRPYMYWLGIISLAFRFPSSVLRTRA